MYPKQIENSGTQFAYGILVRFFCWDGGVVWGVFVFVFSHEDLVIWISVARPAV